MIKLIIIIPGAKPHTGTQLLTRALRGVSSSPGYVDVLGPPLQ